MKVSICICLRNDNYGGDQFERLKKFIEYYSFLGRKYKNFFEFIICDYNSPNAETILSLKLPWHLLSPLKVLVVEREKHERFALGKGRPILDYLGRNVAVRHASSEFVCILNQDIFISDSIARFIWEGRLNSNYFYRADRWDFPFEGMSSDKPETTESYARRTASTLHRRHDRKRLPIDVQVTPGEEEKIASLPLVGEAVDDYNHLFHGRLPSWKNKILQRINGRVDFEFLGLHTNAGGDFIVAPRKTWEKMHGACETTEFYMHLDSYLLAQLYGAGLRQAIFAYPHQVFHADHDRSARMSFQEKVPYEVHLKRMCDIALGVSTYRLNGPDWGMINENLEVIQL